MKIACFTVAAMDHFPETDQYFPGGNALNQAVHFAALGHATWFAGALGTDPAGDRIGELLVRRGVDCTLLHRLPGITACNRIRNDASGERFGEDGAWKNGVYGDFTLGEDDWEYMKGCDVWTTHANCPDFQAALDRKSPKTFLAADFLHLEDPAMLADCLGRLDLACIGGDLSMEGFLAPLAERSRTPVLLTLGAGGSCLFHQGKIWRQEALAVEQVVDTTGCGDAFQAAFTSSWVQFRDPAAALLAGARAGRTCCLHRGALDWD